MQTNSLQTPQNSGSRLTTHSDDTATKDDSGKQAGPTVQPAAPLRVLIIDDNPERAQMVEQGLAEDAVVHSASQLHGKQLLDLVAEILPDVIIMDCESPDRDSIESLRTVVQKKSKNRSSCSLRKRTTRPNARRLKPA